MPTLLLPWDKQKQITKEEADKVSEALEAEPRPEYVTIKGEKIKTSKIVDVSYGDLKHEQEKKRQRKERREMFKKIEEEREQFKSGSPEEKTKFWFYNVFMTKYLSQKGFKQVLGKTYYAKERPGWKEKWNEAFDEYLDDQTRGQIITKALNWYRKNSDKTFPDLDVYKQFLPSGTREDEVEGFAKVK